jgi:hypothetical protein
MGTNKAAFVGDRVGIITGSHVTGSDVSHVTEVAQYPSYWGLFKGRDVSHVTSGRGHVRKRPWQEVCSAHARFIPRIFLVVVHNFGWGCSLRRPRPIFIMVTELALVICPCYFHVICKYIYVVLYSKDGIFKSQMNEMVNLIPTCIVSNKKKTISG